MKSNTHPKTGAARTKRAIVHLLKQAGALDSAALADRLGISAMAVRQHLYALQSEQLVTYTEEPRSMGRPAKLWQLTPAADQFFPEGYAELTVSLLQSMTEAFGAEGLEKLLQVRSQQQITAYQEQIPAQESLLQRLEALAALRTAEGYMAEVEALPDGAFLLIENHCPICAAATACTGLCDRELEIFQAVLGQAVKIERTEHLIAGERRCVYRVTH
jgi:iron-sulfur cluster biosynthesis transcriptional regulator SufR